MSDNSTTEVSQERDLEKVRTLLRRGTLDETLAMLDPSDVKATLAVVPVEIARLVSALLSQGDQINQQVATLKPEERQPIRALIRSARKHRGAEFAEAFATLVKEDKDFGRLVGMQPEKPSAAWDQKIDNLITGLGVYPHMMLKSRRVYLEVGFMQDDNLLFRTNLEIDDLLKVVQSLLNGAEITIEYLQKIGPDLRPQLYRERIDDSLKAISKQMRGLRKQLATLGDNAEQDKRRKKGSKKRPEASKRSTAKRQTSSAKKKEARE
jgi:hypothetical protein